MSSGIRRKQHVNHHADNLYLVFQDLIREKTKIDCTIKVTETEVQIFTKDARDYFLARLEIVGMTGLKIVKSSPDSTP